MYTLKLFFSDQALLTRINLMAELMAEMVAICNTILPKNSLVKKNPMKVIKMNCETLSGQKLPANN